VNTINEELTPWYDNNNHTLYYSSDGWPGIGGLDIFRSRGEYKKFTLPENLTSPINSSYDELYFSSATEGKGGLFTSNRPGTYTLKKGSCCDDIYEYKRVEYIKVEVAGNVSGMKDSTMVGFLPKTKIDLYIVDEREPEPVFIRSVDTDEKGQYTIPLEPGTQYKMMVEKAGYLNKPLLIDTRDLKSSSKIQKDITITALPEDVLVLDNVYYETDKYELKPASKLALDTTLVAMMKENPQIRIEIRSHTDDVASDAYNKNLSQKRAEGVVKYLISQGIEKERLIATGYGESKPRVPNRNPDGSDNPKNREKNRRTEFKVIGTIERTTIINKGEE
jgi:OmpA-OmpF porin, OOP family